MFIRSFQKSIYIYIYTPIRDHLSKQGWQLDHDIQTHLKFEGSLLLQNPVCQPISIKSSVFTGLWLVDQQPWLFMLVLWRKVRLVVGGSTMMQTKDFQWSKGEHIIKDATGDIMGSISTTLQASTVALRCGVAAASGGAARVCWRTAGKAWGRSNLVRASSAQTNSTEMFPSQDLSKFLFFHSRINHDFIKAEFFHNRKKAGRQFPAIG